MVDSEIVGASTPVVGLVESQNSYCCTRRSRVQQQLSRFSTSPTTGVEAASKS